MLRHLIPLAFAAMVLPAAAQGLRLSADSDAGLRARLHLLSSEDAGGSRVLGAQLLGDYYLGGPSHGLRLSGGLMVGPRSLLGSGLAPAAGSGLLGVGHRRLLGSTEEPVLSQPYLGVGFSRYGSAWGVTADLGVAVHGNAALRLGSGSAFTQSLNETLHRLQWTPTLHLGVSYRF